MFTSIRFAPPCDLLERDRDRARVVARLDQPAEARRAGHVRPLADHHEAGVPVDLERLETAEARPPARRRDPTRSQALDERPRIASTCSGRRAAAAADDVDEPRVGELARGSGSCRRAARRARRTRSAGRRSGGRRRTCPRPGRGPRRRGASAPAPSEQLTPTISGSACSTDDPEGLDRLAGEVPPAEVDRGERDPARELGRDVERGRDRRLRVQRVEDRLDHQQVDARRRRSASICSAYASRTWSNVTVRKLGVVDLRRDGQRDVQRAERAGDEPAGLVGCPAREPRALEAHLRGERPRARSRPGRSASR